MDDDKAILLKVDNPAGLAHAADYMFWCPGCKCAHAVWTSRANRTGAVWSFNGNMQRPTFNPSLLLKFTKCPPFDPATGDYARGPDGKYKLGPDGRLEGAKDVVCHSFIRDGHIQFLSDCTHELAGKTVPMEPF